MLTVNPPIADTEIHLDGIPGDENNRATLYIFSVSGMIVHEATLTGSSATINVSSLADGVYIIKAVSKRGCSSARFIKQ